MAGRSRQRLAQELERPVPLLVVDGQHGLGHEDVGLAHLSQCEMRRAEGEKAQREPGQRRPDPAPLTLTGSRSCLPSRPDGGCPRSASLARTVLRCTPSRRAARLTFQCDALQRPQHVLALELIAGLAQRQAVSWARRETVSGIATSSGTSCRWTTGPRGQHDRPVDHVLQLAHVARPVVARERVQRAGRDAPHVALALAARTSRTKCSTSRGMSSRRSRSGGRWIGTTLSR